MSEQYQQYKVGDVVNGHILGADQQWHPLQQAVAPGAYGTTPAPAPRERYFQRFRRRWRKCFLVMAIICGLAGLATGVESDAGNVIALVFDALIGAGFGGLIYGTLVCLVAAAFPQRKTQAQPDHPRTDDLTP